MVYLGKMGFCIGLNGKMAGHSVIIQPTVTDKMLKGEPACSLAGVDVYFYWDASTDIRLK